MKKGFLSSYFEGVAVKRLSQVEADPKVSNQHEFNGSKELIKLFGRTTNKIKYKAQFLYLTNDEGDFESTDGSVTWYDSRVNHTTRSEHRLFYTSSDVSKKFSEGDLLLIGKKIDGDILVLAVEGGSTIENQILWLFGIEESDLNKFLYRDIEGNSQSDSKLNFTSRFILSELGIVIKETNENYLDLIISKFGEEKLPSTTIFSEFARSTMPEVSAIENPDQALFDWMEREEILFRTFERYLINKKIKDKIFDTNGVVDIDSFFSFSLSVQNTRKSRAGQALENHLEEVFIDNKINFSREKQTEKRKKPDFIFPNIESYHDQNFDESLLTMLGAKSTCKDRWRQVLSEANKIKEKHLFTLEPSISSNQTEEMKASNLQLVVPQQIFGTYNQEQQKWLLNLNQFLSLVKSKDSL
jgi:hypothetical protein